MIQEWTHGPSHPGLVVGDQGLQRIEDLGMWTVSPGGFKCPQDHRGIRVAQHLDEKSTVGICLPPGKGLRGPAAGWRPRRTGRQSDQRADHG